MPEAVGKLAKEEIKTEDEKYSATYPAFGERQRKVRYVYFMEYDQLPIEHLSDTGEPLIVTAWPSGKSLFAQDLCTALETTDSKAEQNESVKRIIEWQWLTLDEMPE